MKKPLINYALDWCAFVVLAGMAGTGLVMEFRLPAGSGNATLLGLTRHDWGEVHFWFAISFLVVIAAHLLLHWDWIRAMTVARLAGSPGGSRRGLVAAIGAAVILLLALAPLMAPKTPATRGEGEGRGREAMAHAEGSNTRGEGRGEGRGMGRGAGRGEGRGRTNQAPIANP